MNVRPAAVVFTTAAALGLALLPEGVGLGDAGEIGAAALDLGVAHPTGFPLDMMWLQLARLVPLGSLGFRQNAWVCLVGAAALGGLAGLVSDALARARLPPWAQWIGAWTAALSLGTWATFVGTTWCVEVYGTALLLSLLAWRSVAAGRPRWSTLGLLAGLALGAHITASMGVGAALMFAATRLDRTRWRVAAGALLVFGSMGALVLFYLPLSSARQPMMDWGDPETFARMFEHVSAGRIRLAFSEADPERWPFVVRLAELGAAWVLALYAMIGARDRRLVFALCGLAALDIVYATVVNPMGIADAQVGHHAAGAVAALAGLGAGTAAARVPRLWASMTLAAILVVAVLGVEPPTSARVSEELYGDLVRDLPPRARFVCSSDDGCAGALFARYGIGSRPDVAVVVAQHLWEPRERARAGLRSMGDARPEDGPGRAASSERALHALARDRRTLVLETSADLSLPAPAFPSDTVGALALVTPNGTALVDALDQRMRVRAPVRGTRERAAWSRTFDAIGRGALAGGDTLSAVRAFRRAVELAPERAAGWTNLGVSLAAQRDLAGAAVAAAEAARLDPARATAWVNLARYRAASGDLQGARAALGEAAAHGLDDPRLRELRDALHEAHP